MSVDVGSEARVAQSRKLRRFGWRVDGRESRTLTLDSGLFTECSKAQ